MTYYKQILNLFLILFLISIPTFAIETYNSGNDFTVSINDLEKSAYNDEIKLNYVFTIENLKSTNQEFNINIENKKGWTINYEDNFILTSFEKKDILIEFIANTNFDYSSDVVSSDVIKISQRDDYTGFFQFPTKINGENETISINFGAKIIKPEILPIEYVTTTSTEKLSPISPLKYTIRADNLNQNQNVNIQIIFDKKIIADFEESFKKDNYYKIFSQEISSDISPGNYDVKILIKYSDVNGKSINWEKRSTLEVKRYENLNVVENFKKSLIKDTFIVNVVNNGNTKTTYEKNISVGFLKYFFFDSNNNYENTENGIIFKIDLKKGEQLHLEYYYNYLPLYIISIVLISLAIYIYYRKNSNPLDIETKIYDIKKVSHEGVKGLKIRIGFENYKENEIENIKVIFRMPAYLNIKENSFLLSEPKKVLKGSSQYKMTWEFKRFEKNDTRILGFALINPRGILGDIKLPDLEFELKIKGKIRKYYKSFPTIKG